MESISSKRAVEASANFLIRRGYTILDRDWSADDGQRIDIVAQDGDGVAFVAVTAKLGAQGFGEPSESRSSRELAAAQWLATKGGELVDVPFRFDDIAMMVISGNRAIVRHHIDAINTLEG